MLCGMSRKIHLWGTTRNVISTILGVLGWLLRLLWLMLLQ
jgi:hypothetical protein